MTRGDYEVTFISRTVKVTRGDFDGSQIFSVVSCRGDYDGSQVFSVGLQE